LSFQLFTRCRWTLC